MEVLSTSQGWLCSSPVISWGYPLPLKNKQKQKKRKNARTKKATYWSRWLVVSLVIDSGICLGTFAILSKCHCPFVSAIWCPTLGRAVCCYSVTSLAHQFAFSKMTNSNFSPPGIILKYSSTTDNDCRMMHSWKTSQMDLLPLVKWQTTHLWLCTSRRNRNTE